MPKNEGDIICSIVSGRFKRFSVDVFMDLTAEWICVHVFLQYFLVGFYLGVGHKCVGSCGNKRSIQWFEEPNQKLANFSHLLCSSKAMARLLFSWPSPIILFYLFILLPPSHIPDYLRGFKGLCGICVDALHR